MIQRYEASIYMLGWGVPTFDALYSLQSLVRSVGAQGDGNYNVGRYSNPQMDALVERIKKEVDPRRATPDRAGAAAQPRGRLAHSAAQPDHPLGDEATTSSCTTAPTTASTCAVRQGQLN
jgi:ABC-type transport system substrate-binding protein